MSRMLWLGVVIVVVGLCSSGALAASMGPPVAGLDAGQFSVGFDYSNSDIGVEGSFKGKEIWSGEESLVDYATGDVIDLKEGVIRLYPDKGKFKEDVEIDMYLANLSYGVSDNLEVALLLGMADFSIGDDGGFDGSSEFAYGFGVKATFYEEANLKLGALLQMTFSSADDSCDDEAVYRDEEEVVVVPTKETFDIDYYQLKIAVGPSYKLTEGISVYGGPFYHMVSGDYDLKEKGDVSRVTEGEGQTLTETAYYSSKDSGDIEEESSFGGYIGAQIDITENLPLAVEYQFTGDADILGLSLVYRF